MLEQIVKKKFKVQSREEVQSILSGENDVTMSDLWEAQTKRTIFAKHMLKSWAATKMRTDTGREMDALLMPCSPWPAAPK